VLKNKKAPPLPETMQVQIPIYYREYFPDDARRCYDLARKLQVIRTRYGILTWKRDDEEFLQVEGESLMLKAIREQKLESLLASDLILAAASDVNKARKNPIAIPSTIADLASGTPATDKPSADTKKASKRKVKKAEASVESNADSG
jgi:hypothetical protein